MKARMTIPVIAALIILVTVSSGLYVVDEVQQVVITRFGKPVGQPVFGAGLHWKTPFIEKTHYFDKRILAWDGDPNQIPTKDKKYIWIDMTARWRIKEPLLFLQTVGNETGAHSRLDDIIDAVTRDYVSDNILFELVRNSDRQLDFSDMELLVDSTVVAERVESGRAEIVSEILNESRTVVAQYGIDLVDVRIKRINYVEEVRKRVYERMISERKRIAERYRSEGQGQSAEIEGKRERELQRIRSEAYQKAQEIHGRADAQATRIYADAYNRDPEFYSFLKTLQTYEETVDSTTAILLTTKSEYFKYLKGIK